MNNFLDSRKFALSKGVSGLGYDEYIKKVSLPMMGRYINPSVMETNTLNVTSIDIYSRLMMDRIIFLGTEIDDDAANIISAQMLWLEQQSDADVQLMISSGGGSVLDGYSIIDVMNFIKPEISTTVVGLAASMAAVIASSGKKGKRYILPHSRFMIHQPSAGFHGHMVASDITIEAEEINKLKKELYQTLSENSNLSFEDVEKICDRDKWLTSKEAIDFGFVDEIITKND